nr:hypothetical protein [Halomonas sp. A3H3]
MLLSSAYPLFGECSRRVVSIMQAFTAPVEPYPIDELFFEMLVLTPEVLQSHSRDLRQQVQRCMGIPVSIGVASSRTLTLSVDVGSRLVDLAHQQWAPR